MVSSVKITGDARPHIGSIYFFVACPHPPMITGIAIINRYLIFLLMIPEKFEYAGQSPGY
jgi:hypothetical protein